jgi:transposase
VTIHEKEYRAVVVHSSSHDKRRQKKYDRMVVTSRKSIDDALKKLPSVYACEPDARNAANRVEKLSDELHGVCVTIRPVEVRKPGRPPKNAPAAMTTRYELDWKVTEDADALAKLKKLAGCFVLLTNVPSSGEGSMDSAALLKTYKGQYGVESDFAFLKDPIVVNDIFLKTPSRIDALGMIMIIALMVWRLMERSMRTYVKNTGDLLPGWCSRPTTKPTSFMMSTAMTGITVAKINNKRTLLRAPPERPMAFLRALGLDSNVFLNPDCKCTPIIPAESG